MKTIKVIKYLFVGIILFIMSILLFIILITAINENKNLGVFDYSAYEVKSNSMYPDLIEGDLIVVKKRDKSEYEVGMVVTYKRPTDKTTTTHKIVSIDGDIVTTKGINDLTNNDNYIR